jgi:hypothetical protein
MLALWMIINTVSSVPSPGTAVLVELEASPKLWVAQLSEEQKDEEAALEKDMERAREHLGHSPATDAPATKSAEDPELPPPADASSEKERGPRKKKKRKKRQRGPQPKLYGKTAGYYFAWGIVDANVALGTLVGGIAFTAVALVFADLDRSEEFFGERIDPGDAKADNIAVGFAVGAGALYALSAVAGWRTGVNFSRFAQLNRQKRQQRKMSTAAGPETWRLMGLDSPAPTALTQR